MAQYDDVPGLSLERTRGQMSDGFAQAGRVDALAHHRRELDAWNFKAAQQQGISPGQRRRNPTGNAGLRANFRNRWISRNPGLTTPRRLGATRA